MSGEHNLVYTVQYDFARWTIWYSVKRDECVLMKLFQNGEVETFCSVSPLISKTFVERIPWDDFVLLGEFE